MPNLLIRLIVIKKVAVATLLLLISVSAAIGSGNIELLTDQADRWAAADRMVLARLAQRGVDLGPTLLQVVAWLTGLYAGMVYVAAWASWTERLWGEWLLVVLLVIPLPFELIAFHQETSPRHLVVLGLTILALLVMLRRALVQTKVKRLL